MLLSSLLGIKRESSNTDLYVAENEKLPGRKCTIPVRKDMIQYG